MLKVPPTPLPPAKRWRRRLRRALYIALGLLAILLIAFLLLPVWMSNPQGRAYVLQRLNKNLRASINVDDWSLSWFKGTRLKNLSITLPDGSRLLSCPHVSTQLTLWGILFHHYDLGSTAIDTLQLNLTKYPDGSTSLDSLLPSAPQLFRSVRGSLQIRSAVVTINSLAAAQSVTYTDLSAALTIAAPDAPFHLNVIALQADRSLSLNATLPPPASWPPDPWMLAADIDLSAANLPTGLTADWLRLDPRWQQSFGPSLTTLSFTHHLSPAPYSEATLQLTGSANTSLTARLGLSIIPNHTALLTSGAAAPITASLLPSPPLTALLTRANPVFASLAPTPAGQPITLTADNAQWSADRPLDWSLNTRIVFPPLTFQRTGILSRLLSFAATPAPGPATLTAAASPLRLQISHGELSYDNFTLTFPPPAPRNPPLSISFQGHVAPPPDNSYHLLATVPLAATGNLQSGTTDIPITGTPNNPSALSP